MQTPNTETRVKQLMGKITALVWDVEIEAGIITLKSSYNYRLQDHGPAPVTISFSLDCSSLMAEPQAIFDEYVLAMVSRVYSTILPPQVTVTLDIRRCVQ